MPLQRILKTALLLTRYNIIQRLSGLSNQILGLLLTAQGTAQLREVKPEVHKKILPGKNQTFLLSKSSDTQGKWRLFCHQF